MLDNGEIIVGFIYEEGVGSKGIKRTLDFNVGEGCDVLEILWVFFLIIIIVFVCGYFVLMGSCFGWYPQEAPSKNDLETREGFHNLFCCSELCFFLQVSQEFISTLFSCFTCFWIWNKEKKSNFWILCFSLFKRFLWFESWKKNGVSYDEWGLQGSLSPGPWIYFSIALESPKLK